MPTFSDAEKKAMQERAREQREFKKLSGEEQVSRKIAEMDPHEKKIAQGIHDLVTSIDERLKPQTWYGMPAYYLDGKVVCFFQAGSKFDSRYSTFGFQEAAKLDDGDFWPTSFALIELTKEVENQIFELVKRAIGS
ncbi:MAG: hypothetical protein RLZZ380_118 [Actinomycetota bacterium]